MFDHDHDPMRPYDIRDIDLQMNSERLVSAASGRHPAS